MHPAPITEVRRSPEPGAASWRVVSLSCFAALAYAVFRYHLAGDTPWTRLPLFTMNKAVSFAAAILFAWVHLPGAAPAARAKIGLAAFWLASLHVLMSLALMMPEHYPKLYEGAAYNLAGQVALLFGCLTAMLFALPAVMSIPSVWSALASGQRLFVKRAGYAALLTVALHVFALGIGGWMRPGTWPAGMPPITLLSCVAVLIPLAARPFRARD
jgi:hypothetical protein